MADKRVAFARRDRCKGKRRYSSWGAARHRMRQLGETGMRPYHCPDCGGIHIGHTDPAQGRQCRMMRLVDLIERANGKRVA